MIKKKLNKKDEHEKVHKGTLFGTSSLW